MNPSGLRIGTPALTTRGLVEDDMREIAQVIAAALGEDFESERGLAARAHPGADGRATRSTRSSRPADRL